MKNVIPQKRLKYEKNQNANLSRPIRVQRKKLFMRVCILSFYISK